MRSFTAQGVALIVNAYAKLKREGLVLEPVANDAHPGIRATVCAYTYLLMDVHHVGIHATVSDVSVPNIRAASCHTQAHKHTRDTDMHIYAHCAGEDAGFTLLFAHMSAIARQMGSRCFELPCDAQHVANIGMHVLSCHHACACIYVCMYVRIKYVDACVRAYINNEM